jgi:hypothetical protein
MLRQQFSRTEAPLLVPVTTAHTVKCLAEENEGH